MQSSCQASSKQYSCRDSHVAHLFLVSPVEWVSPCETIRGESVQCTQYEDFRKTEDGGLKWKSNRSSR